MQVPEVLIPSSPYPTNRFYNFLHSKPLFLSRRTLEKHTNIIKPIIDSDPGNSISDFTIINELGKGSYGIVYKVESKINKQIYVIKKIDLKLLKSKHKKEAYQEVQLLRQINHPNMIKYYNSFLEKDILYIVMEYAEGGDLQQVYNYLKYLKIIFF